MKKTCDWVYENRFKMSLRLRRMLLQDPNSPPKENQLPYYEYVSEINIADLKNIKNIGIVTIYELEEFLYHYRQSLNLREIGEKIETIMDSNLKKLYDLNKEGIQMGVISRTTLIQSFKLGVFSCIDMLDDQLNSEFSRSFKTKINKEFN